MKIKKKHIPEERLRLEAKCFQDEFEDWMKAEDIKLEDFKLITKKDCGQV
jgi:hypothetical protein